jgi:hypothetical protein
MLWIDVSIIIAAIALILVTGTKTSPKANIGALSDQWLREQRRQS